MRRIGATYDLTALFGGRAAAETLSFGGECLGGYLPVATHLGMRSVQDAEGIQKYQDLWR
jgi:hypothetical protein